MRKRAFYIWMIVKKTAFEGKTTQSIWKEEKGRRDGLPANSTLPPALRPKMLTPGFLETGTGLS